MPAGAFYTKKVAHLHYYIGIDLGTSATKLLLMDAAGTILNTVTVNTRWNSRTPGGASSTLPTGRQRYGRAYPNCCRALTPLRWPA